MPNGAEVKLSSGGQNILIKAMVEEFCPRITPGGEALYINDTFKLEGSENESEPSRLGIEIPERG